MLFCWVLTGCGGAEIPRASAPSIPDAEARCRAAARTDSPLITEWSAAEKANLQARLRSGALAVEYTGCSMRPLPACTVRGSYRWQRTTLSSDGIEIRSQDDLFAKLPLGAVALEGELARSGRISVRTMVSGQYLLEGSSVADVPDYGECAQATHLLTALSIGSFKLHSGGTLDGGVSAGVGAYGGGARTSSAETLLREAGDFDTCKLATDETTDIGCSSPIQAFLVPLPRFARERGSGTLRVTFAAGSSDRPWELRSNQQFVCRTPCQRWVNPSESYQLRTEGGPEARDPRGARPARLSRRARTRSAGTPSKQGPVLRGHHHRGRGRRAGVHGRISRARRRPGRTRRPGDRRRDHRRHRARGSGPWRVLARDQRLTPKSARSADRWRNRAVSGSERPSRLLRRPTLEVFAAGFGSRRARPLEQLSSPLLVRRDAAPEVIERAQVRAAESGARIAGALVRLTSRAQIARDPRAFLVHHAEVVAAVCVACAAGIAEERDGRERIVRDLASGTVEHAERVAGM